MLWKLYAFVFWTCLETDHCLKKLVFISRGLLCRLLLSKVDFEYEYTQLSANSHSGKRTALLTDAFSNPRFTPQSHSVSAHSHKRTLSRKWTRTLLKMKIGFGPEESVIYLDPKLSTCRARACRQDFKIFRQDVENSRSCPARSWKFKILSTRSWKFRILPGKV